MGHCLLLGGAFALGVQFFLFCVVVSTLLLKWIFEGPLRRPRHIWVFDSLKQGIGASMGHFFNILLAMAISRHARANQCAWYWLEFTLDLTLGLPMSYLLLRYSERTIFKDFAKSGAYFDEISKRIDFHVWLFQTFSWVGIVFVVKSSIAIPLFLFNAELSYLADEMFKPIDTQPRVELVFVTIGWPAICNAIQFYIVDNFLQKQPDKDYDALEDNEI